LVALSQKSTIARPARSPRQSSRSASTDTRCPTSTVERRPVQYDPPKVRTLYEAAGGYEGLLRLARAWHDRVMADEVVSHAFSHGFHPEHSERLAAYWAEALAGPAAFSAAYGDETSVVRPHSGHGPHEEMDRRAITCFDQALEDIGLAGDDRLRQVLHDYFSWATTTTMSRYPRSPDDVPDGLEMPHWSWDGLTNWPAV
jgi:hemoglobin